jgi:hypothetical protein
MLVVRVSKLETARKIVFINWLCETGKFSNGLLFVLEGKIMGFSPFGGLGGIMFSIVPVIVIIGFVFVFGAIIVRSIQGAKQWRRNNESPVLTVDAIVVTKRTNTHNYHHHTGTDNMHHHMSSSTTYYVTFEVASGDRLEFKVPDTEFGMLAEGDHGRLTFQGTRYLGFERSRS